MQKKLERLDTIIRGIYADNEITTVNYLEATELLVKLSNELKSFNLDIVTQQRKLLKL